MDNLKLKQKMDIERMQYGVYADDKLKAVFACYEDAKDFGSTYKKSSNIEIAPLPYFEVRFGK